MTFRCWARILGVAAISARIGVADESPQKSLSEVVKEANAYLESLKSVDFSDMKSELDDLEEGYQESVLLGKEIMQMHEDVESAVRDLNARFVGDLLQRLNETLEKEMNNRNFLPAAERERPDVPSVVSSEQLRGMLDSSQILAETEAALQSWMQGIIRAEFQSYEENESGSKNDQHGIDSTATECLEVKDVIHQVQRSLVLHSKDQIGRPDHTAGASIVSEMTSSTYDPSLTDPLLLGKVWWRKYIPEDWEKLLPAGWEDWNVAIPSSIIHSLGLAGSTVAPPRAVLEPVAAAGACWMMAGNSGQLTIQLPYPIRLTSITIDHVSDYVVPENDVSSAPKVLQVMGYPSCNDSAECNGLNFNANEGVFLGQFTFDIEEKSSVQTFQIVDDTPEAIDKQDDPELYGGDDTSDEGSCSQAAAACSGPPVSNIQGVTVKILENWGNPDYTAIYRVRVHGD